MPVTVALTDVFPAGLLPAIARAVPAGWRHEVARDPSEETRLRLIADADVLICGGAVTTDGMLQAATRLRFVQKTGAGYNNINVDLCKARGIGLARLPGNNAPAVAEHAVLLMLAVYRHLADCDRRVRAGDWFKEEPRATHRELRGKLVGIVGLGHIGREVARRVNAFDARVVYFDAVRQAPGVEAALAAEYLPLDELVRRADIVTVHVPLFPETRRLISRERIGMMKSDAVLINCARGDIVDEEALVEALRAGRLYGAGLDCFVAERAGGTRAFWDLRNVVLTPHIAGSSVENFGSMMERAFANAQRYLAGRPLPPDDVIWVPERAG